MKKTYIIINEQHSLLEDQERILKERFPNAKLEKVAIPAKGLNLQEITELVKELTQEDGNIVFVSPIPAMMVLLSRELAEIKYYKGEADARNLSSGCPDVQMFTFHNDHREKKELPNGKIIFTVAQEGWQLV
jgi:hypothetical protein